MAVARIYGYPERLSARAGEALAFMLSSDEGPEADVSLVRLIHGDEHLGGPGLVEEPVASSVDGRHAIGRQRTQLGNYLVVDDPAHLLGNLGAFTLHAFVHPTLPGPEIQTLLGSGTRKGLRGYGLVLRSDGTLELWLGDGARSSSVRGTVPLLPHTWYFVAASYDPVSGKATLRHRAVVNRYNGRLSRIVPFDYDQSGERETGLGSIVGGGPFLIGGAGSLAEGGGLAVAQCFNGKIDRSGVCTGTVSDEEMGRLGAGLPLTPERTVAYWDTSAGYSDAGIGDRVLDVGPNGLHAMGWNRPVRAQTGWNWAGRSDCFRLAPEQYGGIEFHSDALTDCRWAPTLTLDLSATLRSGAYALKIRSVGSGGHAYVTFFVRAAKPTAKLCFLVPTASYLAYANGRSHMEGSASQVILARVPVLQQTDVDHVENGLEFGLSTYDLHRDGAGVCYTTARRPIFTMDPRYRVPGIDAAWQFPADLSIIAWLENAGYDYEVITDEDLDREGVAALAPYRTVINGTHCEYYSERMLDATEDYLEGGGRVLYLSGNGYYWVVAFRPEEPGIMEVRKLDAGSRAWQARPGECYLATTGERGGLWRLRGRPPQKVVGTGFAAEGMDRSVGYHKMPDSRDEAVSWVFEGVGADVFGGYGLAHGGAVGLEVDRYDRSLGTPPHAYLLASSEPLSQNWQIVAEDVMFMYPGLGGDQHPQVRCDMTLFTTRNDGAVFSASSIAWGSALPCNGFDNEVSRIMRNVVDRFLGEGPVARKHVGRAAPA